MPMCDDVWLGVRVIRMGQRPRGPRPVPDSPEASRLSIGSSVLCTCNAYGFWLMTRDSRCVLS